MTFQFRQHRGALSDSLATSRSFEQWADFFAYIKTLPGWTDVELSDLVFSPYGGDDKRIGWKDVHIVTHRVREGVIGFVEGRP